jgi:hypothetical protein
MGRDRPVERRVLDLIQRTGVADLAIEALAGVHDRNRGRLTQHARSGSVFWHVFDRHGLPVPDKMERVSANNHRSMSPSHELANNT